MVPIDDFEVELSSVLAIIEDLPGGFALSEFDSTICTRIGERRVQIPAVALSAS